MSVLSGFRLVRQESERAKRFLGGSFEFVGWRYRMCREQESLFMFQSALLVFLVIRLVQLGTRSLHLMQASGPASGQFGMILAIAAAALLASLWGLYYNVRRIRSLRVESTQLRMRAGDDEE